MWGNKHTYPESSGSQDLLACNRVNNGKVPLRADDDQDEYRCRIAEAVHKQVHFAQKITKHPAAKV